VEPRSYPLYFEFKRFGNVGIILEIPSNNGQGRVTRIDLTTGATLHHDLNQFAFYSDYGDHLLMKTGEQMIKYDVVKDRLEDIPVSGNIIRLNDTVLVAYDTQFVSLYDMAHGRYYEMKHIAQMEYYDKPYAFLVEYLGRHYLIG
jgi:hypothetical protein